MSYVMEPEKLHALLIEVFPGTETSEKYSNFEDGGASISVINGMHEISVEVWEGTDAQLGIIAERLSRQFETKINGIVEIWDMRTRGIKLPYENLLKIVAGGQRGSELARLKLDHCKKEEQKIKKIKSYYLEAVKGL